MNAGVKRAFRQFVKLVEPIPQVRHVVAFEDEGGDIFTFIERMDDEVSKQVFHCEYQILDAFGDPPIDFHVVYLEGRPLKVFVNPLPPLFFSREPGDA